MAHVLALTDGTASRDSLLDELSASDGLVLLGLNERLVLAEGDAVTAAALSGLPGLLGVTDEPPPLAPGDLEAMLNGDMAAGPTVASLFDVDAAALDEELIRDVLGWLVSVDQRFVADTDTAATSGEPWGPPAACLRDDSAPQPVPPDSPLRAPRFAGDPVLEQCLAGTHRMLAPEEGRAVMKVQAALIDLGFPLPRFGADGRFGDETGQAVSAFKRGQGLAPDDPVVGTGTMAALDRVFAP
ncbi:peptidoglycan-binding protein [Streptomyces griseochromogenes]|uniref:peptidoglycan-binding protein n=1 Tax=Streptomyces griseochromogenes TaxID=68214 RepID=UPI0037BBFA6B